ncbi:MAG: hypothetical protein KKA64_04240, partial [Nanoarchaeota archaeon]|nr:hypothetical protein [Nanoarchaeota archaeon]
MQTNFIPIDYDSFDWQGRNYIKVIGRNEKGKRICVIDSFEPYFWAILKPNLNESQIKKLQEKVQKISFENAGRQV